MFRDVALLSVLVCLVLFLGVPVAAAQGAADEKSPSATDSVKKSWTNHSIKTSDIKRGEDEDRGLGSKAGDPEDPKELYTLAMTYETGVGGVKQDLKEAARLYKVAAEAGYAPAQYKIGLMNEEGEGVLRNFNEAERWYRAAAKQDYTLAQSSLARLYYYGEKVAQDYPEAVALARLAAEGGDAEAQLILGKMYYSGQGVPQNYKDSAYWFKQGAVRGLDVAQYRYALMLFGGVGVKRDIIRAYAWANVAAAQGYFEAAEIRDKIARGFDKKKLEGAQELSRQYHKEYVEGQ